jgi:XRE family aerobic/anaerobic benzoate catabolism transcriptional regulator
MNYSASSNSTRNPLLEQLGQAVRARRGECRLSRKALAERARVSERFLAQLEGGTGNISVVRLQDVAEALDTSAADLLRQASPRPDQAQVVVALLGVRGAGKSTIGERAARRLGVPFVELDALVAREAGMSLSTLFELHGESYFRRVEREALSKFLDATPAAVLATSGSIVTDKSTFAMLRKRTRTIWLRARARDHWDRVVAQGDGRPMKDRTNAMTELEALLKARQPLYEKADHAIDTSNIELDLAVEKVVSSVQKRRSVAKGDVR